MSAVEPVWTTPAACDLPPQEVHIWRARLNSTPSSIHQLLQVLSPDEQQRADRFRFQVDRQRFIVSRGILRTLLGHYLKLEPAQLSFRYGSNGKPVLDLAASQQQLQFNLSHSADLMLCAVTWKCPIGIDLEYLRPIADLAGLTRRFFSPTEHQLIHSLPVEQQLRSFFQHWTCKEALLKAIGKGLVNLSAVEVLAINDRVELVRWTEDCQPIHHWQLHSFVPAPDTVAAIAIERHPGQDLKLTFCQWQNHD